MLQDDLLTTDNLWVFQERLTRSCTLQTRIINIA